jgi:outer membrane protein insertion porin family
VISYEEMIGLVTVRPGNLLTPVAIRESIRRLHRKSLFREITAYVREDGKRAQILFFLRPLPVVTQIEVSGQKQIARSQILAASRIRRGRPAESEDLLRAQDSILSVLKGKGFLDAAVSVKAVCSMNTGMAKVRIEVKEGSSAVVREVRVKGAEFFPRDSLEDLLGVTVGFPFVFRKWEKGINTLRGEYKREGFLTVHVSDSGVSCENGIYDKEREFTEAGLSFDLRERLLSFYREQDYLKASVDIEAGEMPKGGRFLKIVIQEGDAGYIREVRFSGNTNISGKKLRKQMLARDRGLFHPITGSGKFDEREWNADLAAVIGLYQKEGFARARIASVDTDWDDSGGITATIHIEEGPRILLGEILFRGNDHFLREELLRLIVNREGRYVDYATLDQDGEAIATHYRNSGFLDASVTARFETDEGGETGDIRFDIEEGPRFHLGKVVVQGNTLTDSVVVYREVTMSEGAPIGEKDLLSFQQAVFRTGLYKSVRLQRVKRPTEGILDLIVEVEETLFFEYEFGMGYGTDTGARGFVGAKSRNLNRKGRRLSALVSLSEKEKIYLADLREPWIFGKRWEWEGGVTASYTDAERESFSFRRTSVVTSINKTVFERSSVSLQYELSLDDIFDVTPGAILSPEDQGSDTISAIRGLFVLDFRDDPFNPKRGSFNSGSVEYASTFLGSGVDYYKVAGQSSWYFPVFRRNTFLLSGRAGVVRPLRDTQEVPIQKRFFLGGRTTVAELRIPVKYGFLVAAFLDAGSVWFPGDPERDFDLRESVGLGLRYLTPVGPISLDYGWKLDRREAESSSEWHFSIGAVF